MAIINGIPLNLTLPVSIANGGTGQSTALAANNAFINTVTGMTPGETRNIGLALAGTTLSICGGEGTALGAANPGYICIPSKVTPGEVLIKSLTANLSLDLTAIDAFEFGITAGVDWASDVPFFIHAAADDSDNLGIFISRDPTSGAMPVANSIGDAGTDPVTDSQIACICFSDITPADFDANPRVCIGAFRMQYTGGTTRWAVQTLGSKDGIRQSAIDAICSTSFTFPVGQNGATNRYLSLAGAATTLTFEGGVASSMTYTIDRTGRVNCNFGTGTRDNADAGAGAVYVHLPYMSNERVITGVGTTNYGATVVMGYYNVVSNQTYASLNSTAGGQAGSDFSGADDYPAGTGNSTTRVNLTYKAF